MGNQYTKQEDVQTISSNDIHNNIKKAFNMDDDKDNHTLDSIGWYNKQNRGMNYINPNVQRYEKFKNVSNTQMYSRNNLYSNSKLNAINDNSDMFNDTPSNTFIPKKNNTEFQSSDGEITEIKQLRDMINSKFKNNMDSATSIFDNVSSPNSDIKKLKNIIHTQMGGGCGCSGDYFVSPMEKDINLSILKGGSRQENGKQKKSEKMKGLDKSEKSDKSNKSEESERLVDDDNHSKNISSVESYNHREQSNSYDKSISSINHIDEYEYEEHDYDSDNNSDQIEDTTENTEDDTDKSVSTRGQIINVAPFYSTETINASTYFKHLNKNK